MATLDAEVRDKALAATKILSRLGAVRAAYVFGSRVEGRADFWSDIDVAAFMEGIENWDLSQRTEAMTLVMKEAGYEVEAHLFPVSALEHPERGGFAEYIVQHGVCVLGE